MKKSNEQKRVIKAVLENGKERCGRTAAEIAAWSGCSDARTIFYRAKNGLASDEVMICVFLGCEASAEDFDRYLRACGIYLGEEFESGKIIRNYVYENDENYDVFELNDLLLEAGQPPLFTEEAA